MNEKPHLQLYWTMDCPAQKLWIQIDPALTYQALLGGTAGYTKSYNGVTTHISPGDWEGSEKYWISENYGEEFGYFKKMELVTKHPEYGYDQQCPNGLGRDGEYLDHMQRSQYVLENHDVATIHQQDNDKYCTPDNGRTILRLGKAEKHNYFTDGIDLSATWTDMGQACSQQPHSKSYQLSSLDELANAGCPKEDIKMCKAKLWPSARKPELQKYYIYPK